MQDDSKMLEIKDLTLRIGKKRVIDGISFDLHHGRITALVGESGSGKTLTAFSILNLLPEAAVRERGMIEFKGKNIFELCPEEIRNIRGKDIAIVFQEPFTAMNPVIPVGSQISEAITAHERCSAREIKHRVTELLDMVMLSHDTALSYPHELSGGMHQRAILAMALSCNPEVLILDEPTTALDVSVQKEILKLIVEIQQQKKLAVLFITHDFSIVNMIADEVCVMKEGIIVEKGTKEEVLYNPRHRYTQRLIDCVPKLGDKRRRLPVMNDEVSGGRDTNKQRGFDE